jgi:hypothetical protein
MARAAKPGGVVAFDIISEQCLPPEIASKWVDAGHDYLVSFCREYVVSLLASRGFLLLDSFLTPYDVGRSEYLIFRRDSVED